MIFFYCDFGSLWWQLKKGSVKFENSCVCFWSGCSIQCEVTKFLEYLQTPVSLKASSVLQAQNKVFIFFFFPSRSCHFSSPNPNQVLNLTDILSFGKVRARMIRTWRYLGKLLHNKMNLVYLLAFSTVLLFKFLDLSQPVVWRELVTDLSHTRRT